MLGKWILQYVVRNRHKIMKTSVEIGRRFHSFYEKLLRQLFAALTSVPGIVICKKYGYFSK